MHCNQATLASVDSLNGEQEGGAKRRRVTKIVWEYLGDNIPEQTVYKYEVQENCVFSPNVGMIQHSKVKRHRRRVRLVSQGYLMQI